MISTDIVKQNIQETKNQKKFISSIDDLPLRSNSVDCIVCTDVFEHIIPSSQPKIISEMYRVLKPGGKLLISYPGNNLPNISGYFLLNFFIFFIRIFDRRIAFMDRSEPPAHINMSYPWIIKKAFSDAGFKGTIRPRTNKLLSLPKRYHPLVKILNAPLISPLFICLMHGLLIKHDE